MSFNPWSSRDKTLIGLSGMLEIVEKYVNNPLNKDPTIDESKNESIIMKTYNLSKKLNETTEKIVEISNQMKTTTKPTSDESSSSISIFNENFNSKIKSLKVVLRDIMDNKDSSKLKISESSIRIDHKYQKSMIDYLKIIETDLNNLKLNISNLDEFNSLLHSISPNEILEKEEQINGILSNLQDNIDLLMGFYNCYNKQIL